MCGIAGISFPDKEKIEKMNLSQKHRGPDNSAVFIDHQISLGHTRLSIIDLSEQAHQPMKFNDFIIIFNGEIYNFLEVKQELINLGHSFSTNSDTEVILQSYSQWGETCVNKFNGMWAFCIYDTLTQKLFLSRDRFGIKPLYYFYDQNNLIFSSEIRAIVSTGVNLTINTKALNFYLYQKYIHTNESIYNEIKTILPGHNGIFDIRNKSFEIKQYYFLEKEIELEKKIPLNERLEEIKTILPDSIIKRLISDVPVGSFLSGGVDSSYISAVIAKKHPEFNTFSIGFKEDTFNELKFAETVSEHIGVKHHKETPEFTDEIILEVINKLDQPFGDPALIPTYILSKMTKKHVSVCLSGDAGDEVFAGYDTYKAFKIARFIPNFVFKTASYFTKYIPDSDKNLPLSYKFKKFVQEYDKNPQKAHLNRLSQTDEQTRKNLLGKNFHQIRLESKGNDLLSIQINDFTNYLSGDILPKTDIASMLNSLEARVPFLDYRLVAKVLSLPEKYKLKGLRTKFLLKKIAEGLIPKTIINRNKKGFSVPVSLWFKNSIILQNYITDKKYYQHNIIDFDYSNKLLNLHLLNKRDNSRALWLIFVFNSWYFNNFVLQIQQSTTR